DSPLSGLESGRNQSGDTNPDTNPDTNLGTQLWTTMDGLIEIEPKIRGRKMTMDFYGQSAALSKNAGCRLDSCPTCPFPSLETKRLPEDELGSRSSVISAHFEPLTT